MKNLDKQALKIALTESSERLQENFYTFLGYTAKNNPEEIRSLGAVFKLACSTAKSDEEVAAVAFFMSFAHWRHFENPINTYLYIKDIENQYGSKPYPEVSTHLVFNVDNEKTNMTDYFKINKLEAIAHQKAVTESIRNHIRSNSEITLMDAIEYHLLTPYNNVEELIFRGFVAGKECSINFEKTV